MSKTKINSNKIGLVLSGGGTRGFAHLGALKVIESAGIKIDAIAGCSSGAIVGALYASGKSTKEIIDFISTKKIFDFFDISLSKLGIQNMSKLEKIIQEFTGATNFNELKIPLYINATNISKGREDIFSKGKIFDAIRASISVPGLFAPYKIKNDYYIDGGILNQNPFSILPQEINKYIIINTSPYRIIRGEKDMRLTYILNVSLKMMQTEITRIKLESISKENYILITPHTDDVPILQFSNKRFNAIMKKGEHSARNIYKELINFSKNAKQ